MKSGSKVVRWVAGVAILAGVMGGMGGCSNQQVVDGLRDQVRTLTDRNTQLVHQVQELQNESTMMGRQRSAGDTAVAELQKQLTDARNDADKYRTALAKFDENFKNLQLGPLDPETDAALAALAAQNPGLITYDAAKGMLRFSSDLTFDSGSDTLKEGAKTSLASLGKVLSGASAANYEVLIVGHTDSQPVSAATQSRGHPSNLHLSCHRAISVMKELNTLGVPPQKMYAAGRGEYHPLVANSGNGNTPANRRVEIFLTRGTSASLGDATPATQANPNTRPADQPDFTK